MTRILHRLTSVLMAAALVFVLAACGDVTPDQARTYIQGDLDACYLGQYNQDYLDLIGITAEEAEEQNYVWNTTAEAEILMDYFDIYPTDASAERAVALIRDIYALSKYQVGAASKLDDGSYAVTVTVQPMDILVRYTSQNDAASLWAAALDRHGIYSQEALDAAKAEAERLLSEWESGDKTAESFGALAEANSDDTGSNTNGGLYEQVSRGRMFDAFDAWIFDESRQPGDTTLVENPQDGQQGWHVIYFQDWDNPVWKNTADSSIRSQRLNDWVTSLTDVLEAVQGSGAKYVGE